MSWSYIAPRTIRFQDEPVQGQLFHDLEIVCRFERTAIDPDVQSQREELVGNLDTFIETMNNAADVLASITQLILAFQ
eukprot:CAMPEP_0201900868 /NCGR_PEP_ID=MMETSP0902-20130614/53229_1 /ASSEMBLY_ACC=CAM_ASM_000551 /TAXON_ID=420261 /ORGANISM="Thalassiosira antarctica, Strain CCMP982" /LENGTH=77 /DNA_ID=CAMNT_0048434669 /DNA_START=147 /DNA_END=380 /DNA_ORIENTATION=+